MLIYLDQALNERRGAAKAQGRNFNRSDLHRAIMEGAVERVRPKMMTVVAIMAGLIPILWSTGAGSEIMQRRRIACSAEIEVAKSHQPRREPGAVLSH